MMLKFWIIHLPVLIGVTQCLHINYICLINFTFLFFRGSSVLEFFMPISKFCQILYKMQVIVELPLYAFLFASLN